MPCYARNNVTIEAEHVLSLSIDHRVCSVCNPTVHPSASKELNGHMLVLLQRTFWIFNLTQWVSTCCSLDPYALNIQEVVWD